MRQRESIRIVAGVQRRVSIAPTSNEGMVMLFIRSSLWASFAATAPETAGSKAPEFFLDLDLYLLGERIPCDGIYV